jgi:hypothetical protein
LTVTNPLGAMPDLQVQACTAPRASNGRCSVPRARPALPALLDGRRRFVLFQSLQKCTKAPNLFILCIWAYPMPVFSLISYTHLYIYLDSSLSGFVHVGICNTSISFPSRGFPDENATPCFCFQVCCHR